MSKGTLGQVVKRAISDAAFRRQLQADPEGALKGFDLSSDERAALRSGDASKLSSLGIDQRMSKAFTLGEGASAVSKWGTGNDLAMGATVPDGGEPIISDGLAQSGRSASDTLIDSAGGARAARISDAGGSVRSGITSEGTGARTALGDQHDGGRAAIGDSAAGGREGTAYITADEAGRDASALGSTAAAGREGSAFITADERGTDVIAGGPAGGETSLDVSGQTRDASALGSTAAAGREGSAFITADEAGRDASASALGSSGSNATSAFMTADEMGNDVVAGGNAGLNARVVDSADAQREALEGGTSMANPEGHATGEPTA